MEKSKICLILLTISLFASSTYAKNKLSAVTATADLADFVRNIGGDKVEVVSLSVGNQDLHAVEPRPSMVMKVKKAGLLVRVGMDIDLWMQGVIEASRNKNVMRDAKGYLDASLNIHKLEVPEGKIDASMGDIHIYGNPHYLYGPENAAPILKAIKSKLSELSPENKEYFQENCNEYSGFFKQKTAYGIGQLLEFRRVLFRSRALVFFQAEDGIRDWSVTGVQTCALLFSSRRRHTRLVSDWSSDVCSSDLLQSLTDVVCRLLLRSEERRVGKGCRSRW